MRGFGAQLMAYRRVRNGEPGVVEDAEGVMLDASDEIADPRATAGEASAPRCFRRKGGQDELDL